MKVSSLITAALVLFTIASTATLMWPTDALAESALSAHLTSGGFDQILHYIATPLAVMRANLGELETRAASMLDDLDDDASDEDVRRVEAEHTRVLGEIETLRTEISEQERAENGNTPAALPAADTGAADVAARAAVTAERIRTAEIQDLCRRHAMTDDFQRQHVTVGSDVQAVRTAILAALAERSEANTVFPHVEFGAQNETDSRRTGMTAAIVARLARASGQRNVDLPEHARPWAEREMCEIAAECVNWRGPLRTARQMTEMFERAFHTTSDFPSIFTDALNNRLLDRYQLAEPTYRLFTARFTTPDFRETNVIRAGDFPMLQPVSESGEVKAGTFGESKEAVQTKAYGVQIRITRVMLINDQLMAIDQVLGSAGGRVADWENAQVFTLLASGSGAGPTLKTDSKRVFHTDHKNLAGSGAAPSVATIGAGRAAMAKQTTLDGIKANFQPRTVLCSPDTITATEQLLATLTPAKQSDAVPESLRRLVPVSDPNISGTPWYLFADPTIAPVFGYSYLEGFEGPRLTSEDGFDVQGMKVKLEHDFGTAAIDYRGGYRNPGA